MYILNDGEVRGMLLQFKFSNFRCFAEEVAFDMVAAPIKEHKYSLIDCNGVNVLPVAAVYGANASGKTSFFMAIERMRSVIVQRSLASEALSTSSVRWFSNPFMFDRKSESSATSYEASVLIDEYQYRYGFTCTRESILEEHLYKKKFSKNPTTEKMIFQCSGGSVNIGLVNKKLKDELIYCSSMKRDRILLLTDIGLRGKETELCSVFDWFSEMNVVLFSCNDALVSNSWCERMIGDYISKYKNSDLINKLISFIHEIDPSIETIKTVDATDSDGKIVKIARTVHVVNQTKYDVPFELESDGTNKLFHISLLILCVLEIGGTIFIDELDSKIHPLILRRIIQLFKDKESNSHGAQLIFSAHNIICLDSSDLRRDEIWFVEKTNHRSTMYSLIDFDDGDGSVRSDLSFGKHYLSGRFGAVPFQNEE